MPAVSSKFTRSSWLVGGLATLAIGIGLRQVLTRLSEKKQSAKSSECVIDKTKNVLLVLADSTEDLGSLADDFCGIVITDLTKVPSFVGKTVYLCGDIAQIHDMDLEAAKQTFIVDEHSHNYHDSVLPRINAGRVPTLVHGVGIQYKQFFDPCVDCFSWIQQEHAFQTLTESTKPGTAHRTGVYLTPVEQHGDKAHFRLLRCSSNFSGPTVNFGASDRHVVDAMNHEAANIFDNQAPLNHVLAQIYHNMPAEGDRKQTKAKIKAHSDKTKDMPTNGLMAFCTFYDNLNGLKPLEGDRFDYGHKGVSAMTTLHFSLKSCVASRPGCTLKKSFSVKLYPNSVFFMPLSTNRLYTHEIRPSALDASMLPTRMGYVVRCSSTEAVHEQGQTFLKASDESLVKLEKPTHDGMVNLRQLYAEENSTDDAIDYTRYGPLHFSMNQGDYMKPVHSCMQEGFQSLMLPPRVSAISGDAGNLFEELLASVCFEQVGKGRQGTVLVKPHSTRGVPIVRTTTKYNAPAFCFQNVHTRLAEQIQKSASLPAELNNALIETYTNAYTTMGFHSDQDLDLEDETDVAVFSCYKHPELARTAPRKLIVESKEANGGRFEIPMAHNSVVVFSHATNRRFKHKIVLDTASKPADNQWLGVTFRTSKTFVKSINGKPHFEDGTPLTKATAEQQREFYSLRSQENASIGFEYSPLSYTISDSDLMPPSIALNKIL